MTVYIAECHHDYEGFEIIGVFSTTEKAIVACRQYCRADGRTFGDGTKVRSFTLDELVLVGISPNAQQ